MSEPGTGGQIISPVGSLTIGGSGIGRLLVVSFLGELGDGVHFFPKAGGASQKET